MNKASLNTNKNRYTMQGREILHQYRISNNNSDNKSIEESLTERLKRRKASLKLAKSQGKDTITQSK